MLQTTTVEKRLGQPRGAHMALWRKMTLVNPVTPLYTDLGFWRLLLIGVIGYEAEGGKPESCQSDEPPTVYALFTETIYRRKPIYTSAKP